jgi:uncharacterized membrane protein
MELASTIQGSPTVANIPLRERLLAAIGKVTTALIGARQRTAPAKTRGRRHASSDGVDQRRTVLIDRPSHELYRVLRDLEILPRFLDHLAGVTAEDDRTWRFLIRDGEHEIHWRARLTEDVPGNCLAWESLPGGDLIAGGSISLRDGRHGGTVVDLELWYRPAEHAELEPAVVHLFERFTGRRLAKNLLELRSLIDDGVIVAEISGPIAIPLAPALRSPA